MADRNKAGQAARKLERIVTRDETGKIHPFYEYAPLETMPGQIAFFRSEARIQAFLGGNKIGKTKTLHQKLRCIALGYDPTRPGYKFPFDNKYKLNIWLICPPDMVEKELQDLARGFPRDVRKKVYRSSGKQRIEGEPTAERPLGWSIYVKSRQKPIEEFQYDVCHVIAYDEQPPEDIWNECSQRLTMTSGWIMISLTPVLGVTWLHTKLRKLDASYKNLLKGDFGWYTGSQFENPHIPKGEIEFQAQDYSEEEYAIRILGEYRLLAGSQFFTADVLRIQRETMAKEPEYSITFAENRHGICSTWNEKSNGWKVWEKPIAGAAYVIGADVASGKGGDYSVAHVLNVETGEQVAMYRDKWIEPIDFAIELGLAGFYYNNAIIFPEINSDGAAVLHALRKILVYPAIGKRSSYGGRIDDIENTYGWMTGKHNKKASLNELHGALRNATQGKPGVIIRDQVTLDELVSFGHLNENRSGAYGLGALEGHDDCVMALTIALQAVAQSPRGMLMKRNVRVIQSYAASLVDRAFEAAEEKRRIEDENDVQIMSA